MFFSISQKEAVVNKLKRKIFTKHELIYFFSYFCQAINSSSLLLSLCTSGGLMMNVKRMNGQSGFISSQTITFARLFHFTIKSSVFFQLLFPTTRNKTRYWIKRTITVTAFLFSLVIQIFSVYQKLAKFTSCPTEVSHGIMWIFVDIAIK